MKKREYIFFLFILLKSLSCSAQLSSDSVDFFLKEAKSTLYQSPEKSKEYARQAYNLGVENQKATASKILGILADIKGNYDSAIYYYNESAKIFLLNSDSLSYADVKNNIGYTLSNLGEYDKAIKLYYESLRIYELFDNKEKTARNYINLGIVFQKLEDLDEALRMYKRSLQIDSSLIVYRLATNNISTIQFRKGEYEQALKSYDTLIKVSDLLNDKRGIAISLNNKAECLQALDQLDDARTCYLKSIQIKEEFGIKNELAPTYQNLAELEVSENRFSLAEEYLFKSQSIAQEQGRLDQLVDAKLLIAKIYQQQNKFSLATEYYSEYIQVKDSLDKQNQKKLTNELNERFKNEQNQRIIVQLELDKKNAELALSKYTNQRNFFLFFSTLLLLFIGLISLRFIVRKRHSAILEKKNKEISKALADREVLLKEIHHRVKNNLQVISSLLNLQAEYLEKDAQEAVIEGRNRVKSMALIHQRLYQADNLKGISFSEYLRQLVNQLFSTYNINDKPIELITDMEEVNLDVDSAIPIGLIMNELISNSLKYAFNEERKGLLEIRMKIIESELLITVRDNGIYPELRTNSSNTFGTKLISALAQKINATVENSFESGYSTKLHIRDFKIHG